MRSALVTGGSRGIGAAIAARLRGEGLSVETPTRAELDLADSAAIGGYVGRIRDFDILVNCAGENPIHPIEKLTEATWSRVQDVNLKSAFLLTQALAPRMASKGWGRIVNISSCYAIVGRAGRAAYSASKAGLGGLTRATAIEFGPRGVLANAVCPGFVETDLTRQNNTPEQLRDLASRTALGRLAEPGEIAELVEFLVSERNTYLTGQEIVIDGGFTCQ